MMFELEMMEREKKVESQGRERCSHIRDRFWVESIGAGEEWNVGTQGQEWTDHQKIV